MIVKDRPFLDISHILDDYINNKKSVDYLAKQFRVRSKTMSDLIKVYVPIRGSRRYTDIVIDFFKTIDTEAKAYWLGFLYADGYIAKSGSALEVSLAIKDKKHLEKFRDMVGPSLPIKVGLVRIKKLNKTYKRCRLFVCSSLFVSHLVANGCYNNKSLTLIFPDKWLIPDALIHHFIRGYFDGDGSVIDSKKDVIAFDLLGTADMLVNIQNVFQQSIPGYQKVTVQVSKNKKYCNIRKTGKSSCQAIADYLYSDSKVFLERKKYLFTKLCRAK